MKHLLTSLFLLYFLNLNAQEANICNMFIEEYNASSDGFPSLRSSSIIDTDTIKKFKINEDFLKLYDLKKGSILMKNHLKSEIYRAKTYSKWTLFLAGETITLQNQKWDNVKESVLAKFSSLAQLFATRCLVDLQMSELILTSDVLDFDLATYYFYPKQISIPKNTSNELMKEKLKERTYIVLSIKRPMYLDGFYWNYSIQGIKYD